MKLAIDIMGGDNAPIAILDGVRLALENPAFDGSLQLYGDAKVIEQYFDTHKISKSRCTIHPTTQIIGFDEHPTAAIRAKKDSSIVRAIRAVAEGEADCVVSAGSTGALLTGATLIIKRQAGVLRPALSSMLPTMAGGRVLLLDCGANADSKPEYIAQFARMGHAYMRQFCHIESPKVALLSNGTEAEKGSELIKAAHELLKADTLLNFQGNTEARDLLAGHADVIVADGFSGNIALKASEGAAAGVMGLLKTALSSSLRAKLGAALAMPALRGMKRSMDYTEYGGGALLGVRGGVLKVHGSAQGKTFAYAILQAVELCRSGVVGAIGELLRGHAD
ncbi:MAG: phosphate acyltransferase PlsX [Clostridiales bacterium]|nr:phosphate acyltransferase PlsX [Clostridiales bacterium]